jgi:phosphotriesterase-related protein
MIEAGFIDQIMLGTDGARRSLWSSLGGSPGLAWLYSGWSKKLIESGLTQEQLNKIFIDNPARALTLDVQSSENSRGR